MIPPEATLESVLGQPVEDPPSPRHSERASDADQDESDEDVDPFAYKMLTNYTAQLNSGRPVVWTAKDTAWIRKFMIDHQFFSVKYTAGWTGLLEFLGLPLDGYDKNPGTDIVPTPLERSFVAKLRTKVDTIRRELVVEGLVERVDRKGKTGSEFRIVQNPALKSLRTALDDLDKNVEETKPIILAWLTKHKTTLKM